LLLHYLLVHALDIFQSHHDVELGRLIVFFLIVLVLICNGLPLLIKLIITDFLGQAYTGCVQLLLNLFQVVISFLVPNQTHLIDSAVLHALGQLVQSNNFKLNYCCLLGRVFRLAVGIPVVVYSDVFAD